LLVSAFALPCATVEVAKRRRRAVDFEKQGRGARSRCLSRTVEVAKRRRRERSRCLSRLYSFISGRPHCTSSDHSFIRHQHRV
jgi:hypothetical protein